MKWLIAFSVLDLITGIVMVIVTGQTFSIKKLIIGILKKWVYIVLVIIGKYIQSVYGVDGAYNSILLICVSYEIISNLENILKISPKLNSLIETILKYIRKE